MRSDNNGLLRRSTMSRKLVWIEQQHFRGFGCSECAWVFKLSVRPLANLSMK